MLSFNQVSNRKNSTEREYVSQKMYCADAMGFLAPPAEPIVADPDLLYLDLVHVTVAPPMPLNSKQLVPMVQKSSQQICSRKRFQIGRTAKDLVGDLDDKITVVMGLQNSPTDYAYDDLFECGVRVVQLAYQDEHDVCGGFAWPRVPINDRCRQVLENLARLGMILDLSHLGHTSARQVLEHIEKEKLPLRVMISHTGCYRVYPHMRNLPDDVIQKVAQLGGVVGIYCLTFGLDWQDNGFAPFVRHLQHAIYLCGCENVVIGSDGTYQSSPEAVYLARCESMRQRFDPYGLFNVRTPNNVIGTEHPDKMEIIRDGLQMFFTSQVVTKVVGTNLHRFFTEALPKK
jgi:microsomal dipeptidase-like Zn-dependent dipeptidase